MRWDRLIADLEGQAQELAARERQAEAVDRIRREFAQARVADRLRASVGREVTAFAAAGDPVRGTLSRVGAGWLLLHDGAGAEHVLLTAHLVSLGGLAGDLAAPMTQAAQRVHDRLGVPYLLRGLAADRAAVRVSLLRDELIGTIDRVGADFVELAVHAAGEQRRGRSVREIRTVLSAAIVAIRRLGG